MTNKYKELLDKLNAKGNVSQQNETALPNKNHENKRTPLNTFECEECRLHFVETLNNRILTHSTTNTLHGKNTSINQDVKRFFEVCTSQKQFSIFFVGLNEIFKVSRFVEFSHLIESIDCAISIDGNNAKATKKITELVMTAGTKTRHNDPYLWFALNAFANKKHSHFSLENLRESLDQGRNDINKPITTGTLNTQSSQCLKTLQILGLTKEGQEIRGQKLLNLAKDNTLQFLKDLQAY